MTLNDQPLEELRARCEEQLQSFLQKKTSPATACAEILRRAASYDAEALETLLGITEKSLIPRYPRPAKHLIEDWKQEILISITLKFRSHESPYRLQPEHPFPSYRSFVKIVAKHATYDLTTDDQFANTSLNQFTEQSGYELPNRQTDTTKVHQRMIRDRILALIPKSLDREIFRLRFVRNLSPDEVVAYFAQESFRHPLVTKQMVFRSVERTIAKLSQIPEIREMFESDGEND